MSYQLTIEERPSYIHAKVVGERTAENVMRFLKEAYVACVKGGRSAVLLEMALSGPSLSTTTIFEVISQGVPEGVKLRKIAYVQREIGDSAMPYFAELVARNRGVNVRLFPSVGAAELWLSQEGTEAW